MAGRARDDDDEQDAIATFAVAAASSCLESSSVDDEWHDCVDAPAFSRGDSDSEQYCDVILDEDGERSTAKTTATALVDYVGSFSDGEWWLSEFKAALDYTHEEYPALMAVVQIRRGTLAAAANADTVTAAAAAAAADCEDACAAAIKACEDEDTRESRASENSCRGLARRCATALWGRLVVHAWGRALCAVAMRCRERLSRVWWVRRRPQLDEQDGAHVESRTSTEPPALALSPQTIARSAQTRQSSEDVAVCLSLPAPSSAQRRDALQEFVQLCEFPLDEAAASESVFDAFWRDPSFYQSFLDRCGDRDATCSPWVSEDGPGASGDLLSRDVGYFHELGFSVPSWIGSVPGVPTSKRQMAHLPPVGDPLRLAITEVSSFVDIPFASAIVVRTVWLFLKAPDGRATTVRVFFKCDLSASIPGWLQSLIAGKTRDELQGVYENWRSLATAAEAANPHC